MSQHGAMPAAWEETSFTGRPQGAGGHLVCPGLRQCAVRPDAVPGFQKMCRVLDTPFSTISASILFELRADAGEPAALAAFHQVCAPGGPGTAELFDRAVSALKSDGSRYCRGDGLRHLWAADGRESFRRANLLYSLLYSLLYIPLYRKLLYKAENCCIRRYTSDTHCVKALHSYTATIQLYSAIQRYTLYSYTALYTIQPVQHPSGFAAAWVRVRAAFGDG